MPSTRPRVQFTKDGVCNGCETAKKRQEIDWSTRREALRSILREYRGQHPVYDCIVAWSGGKDSSAIALRLKQEFDVNPLLVTFSPLIPTVEGQLNRRYLVDQGFDAQMVQPNGRVSRQLSRRFFVERGDPKIHWNAGINSAPMRAAVALGIPLVFYAEHGEAEYGGRVLSERHLMERDIDEVLEHQIGDDPLNWATDGISESDLWPYQYPDAADVSKIGLRALYFAYFYPWDVTENYKFVSESFPFVSNYRGRTYGTFTDYDSVDDVMDDLYYYMQYIKFGFGRTLRDAARMIQRGKMSTDEARGLIRQYDGEFPEDSMNAICDYLGLTRTQVNAVIDKHREPWLWHQSQGGEWGLRQQLLAH